MAMLALRLLLHVLISLGSPVAAKIFFEETFSDSSWEERWIKSKWKESQGSHGMWHLGFGTWHESQLDQQGLKTGEDARHFTISAPIEPPIITGTKKLIIQYQVQYGQEEYGKDDICHGGYIKLGPKMPDMSMFGADTPFHIMFGPDLCGYIQRTLATFTHKGKAIMKKKDLPYKQVNKTSHLYRLVLLGNGGVRVDIDEERIYSGDIGSDWEMTGAQYIPDPKDKKPAKWVDEYLIDSPRDKKPEDWVDERRVVDTAAKKPSDWDDEADGEWELPLKDNPHFIGVWRPKRVDNPNYRGYWEPRKIDNPDYKPDHTIANYELAWVGFDLWQVHGGTLIDNILITDSYDEANLMARKWRHLNEYETNQWKKAEEEKKKKRLRREESYDDDDEDILDLPHEYLSGIDVDEWDHIREEVDKEFMRKKLGPHGHATPPDEELQPLLKASGGRLKERHFKVYGEDLMDDL